MPTPTPPYQFIAIARAASVNTGLARLDARRSSSAANRGHRHGQRRRDVSRNIRRTMAGL
jgi:hypothetical protein